jgi:hypothetical protein
MTAGLENILIRFEKPLDDSCARQYILRLQY